VNAAMMALRAHTRGGPERLVYERAPVPVPGPGEALVAVHAAAITFAELTWDLSWTTRDGRDRTPVIPSHEMSGTVAAIADGVAGVTVGDEVFGLIEFDRDGAAAEYAAVPAAELAAKPRSASHADAATLPLAALTAWQALVDYAALEPGERVLVHGGAGGVGAFAVQLAAILGAHVTATGRDRDAGSVRDLGAETVAGPGDDLPDQGFDVVIDTVGGTVLDASYDLMRPGGRLVTLGAPPSQERAKESGVHAMFFVVTPDPGELARLAQLTDDGRLRAVVSQTFPLRDGRQAYESGSSPRPPGKTVLLVRLAPARGGAPRPGLGAGRLGAGPQGGYAVAAQVVVGHLAAGHGHDQGQDGARDLGSGAVGPVGIGGAQREPGDAALGADEQVRALVEVRDRHHRLGRVLVLDAQGAPDVLAVHDRLAEPGLVRARRVLHRGQDRLEVGQRGGRGGAALGGDALLLDLVEAEPRADHLAEERGRRQLRGRRHMG
jgi:NADPH:quinone reductase-like Zn-dependent oxidoreductase